MDPIRDRPELPTIELQISPRRHNGKHYMGELSFELGSLRPVADYTVERYVPEARALALERRIEELEEARTEIARLKINTQMDAQIVQAVRETCHDFEDRLMAAVTRIEELEVALAVARSNECRCW